MSTRTMRCGAKFTKRYADKPGRRQTRGHARLTGRWRTPRTAGSAGLTAKQALPHSLPIPPPENRRGKARPAPQQRKTKGPGLGKQSPGLLSLPRRPARNRQKDGNGSCPTLFARSAPPKDIFRPARQSCRSWSSPVSPTAALAVYRPRAASLRRFPNACKGAAARPRQFRRSYTRCVCFPCFQ